MSHSHTHTHTHIHAQQMALLEESMVTVRLHFNERFLYLRDLKREIIKAVKEDNARIHEIDAELADPSQSSDLWEPELNPKEVRTCVCMDVSDCVCVRILMDVSVHVRDCWCVGG